MAHAATFPVFAFLLIAASCGGERDARNVADSLVRNYSTTDSSGRVPLGGVNMWAYCVSIGYQAVGYKRGYLAGPQAAHANWVCQRGTEQLKPLEPKDIDVNDACRWQYKRPEAVARTTDPDHAWSWNCFAR